MAKELQSTVSQSSGRSALHLPLCMLFSLFRGAEQLLKSLLTYDLPSQIVASQVGVDVFADPHGYHLYNFSVQHCSPCSGMMDGVATPDLGCYWCS